MNRWIKKVEIQLNSERTTEYDLKVSTLHAILGVAEELYLIRTEIQKMGDDVGKGIGKVFGEGGMFG